MLCCLKSFVSTLILSIAILAIPAAAAPQDQLIGATENVVGEVYRNNLLRRLKIDDDLYQNQRVRAGVDSAAGLRFLDQSRLTVGPRTEIVLDKFVYDPGADSLRGTVKLVRGVLRFTSDSFDREVTFKTPAVTVGIRGTVFDMMVTGRSTEIAVHEGRVLVTGRKGSILLGPGKTVFVGADDALTVSEASPSTSNRGTPAMQSAVADMLARVGGAPTRGTQKARQTTQPQTSSEPLQSASRFDPSTGPGSEVLRDKNFEDLLYIDLSYGRVIVEMRSDLAPRHVARIKALVRAGFYDGLTFHNVIPGRFSMSGDPTGTGRGGSGTTLDAEFSNETFGRGSIGMDHDRGKPNSADSQFFVSLQPFPGLDGKYTLWGQVIHGMQFIDQLRAGSPPAKPDIILRMRVAADVTG